MRTGRPGKDHLRASGATCLLLILNGEECPNQRRQSVLKFSKNYNEQLQEMKEKAYELKKAKVNFIVFWLNERSGNEEQIILPELYFERRTN